MNTKFDFQQNNIQVLDLDTLQRTHKENDIYGNPLRGLYHYEVINRVVDICKQYGLKHEVEEIFAAQNKSRQNPGVVILPQVEAIHGDNAAEAHILRRVYTTIRLKDAETSEMTTNLVIAYHQDGIQVAFGPNVRICHNQCILNRDRIASNYGKEGVSNEQLFESVGDWMRNFFEYRETDLRILDKMREINCTQNDVFQLIGLLTSLRVAHDSANAALRSEVKTYPLTQSQISQFTEDYLEKAQEQSRFSLWDIYNIATEMYKPGKTDIPNLIPQNFALMEVLTDRYSLH
ncbi:MAG: DUF932 domain-containing protein [Bacteroidales bacterium]|nr:DUF932 domain-containing protein [Bacteroidales bacterium]